MDRTAATAIQPLAPQLIRYGISILGSVLVGAGIVKADDYATISDGMQVIAGTAIAILPPLWRVITTLRARREVG